MNEIWKDILGFEGKYQVSNLGRVKSLERLDPIGRKIGGIILKQKPEKHGYCVVKLHANGTGKTTKVHKLVAIHFLDHTPCGWNLVVNHKDFNRTNNNVDNLEIVTNRENSNKKHISSSSEYVGVYWNKKNNKWKAQIQVNNRRKHLGSFINEYDAYLAYENKLKTIKH